MMMNAWEGPGGRVGRRSFLRAAAVLAAAGELLGTTFPALGQGAESPARAALLADVGVPSTYMTVPATVMVVGPDVFSAVCAVARGASMVWMRDDQRAWLSGPSSACTPSHGSVQSSGKRPISKYADVLACRGGEQGRGGGAG